MYTVPYFSYFIFMSFYTNLFSPDTFRRLAAPRAMFPVSPDTNCPGRSASIQGIASSAT
jgi:hypothetical protein